MFLLQTQTPLPKEIMRQPQRVHKPFHRLNHHDRFFIGSKEFWKVGFCRYQQINKAAHTAEEWGKQTRVRFIAPWTVVRSDEFVNKRITPITAAQLAVLNESAVHRNEKNKKIMATYHEGQKPYTEAELLNSGKTHYVGDGCVPPHPEFETRCVKQPSSDNNVTGASS